MNTLRLQYKGTAPDENLSLQEFAGQLAAVNDALSALDVCASRRGKRTIEVRVSDLTHSSPSGVTIQTWAMEDSLEDNSKTIVPRFMEAIEMLNSGNIKEVWTRPFLEAIARIASGLKREVKELLIADNQSEVLVKHDIARTIETYLEEERKYVGVLRGKMEYLNLHEGQNTFKIYPIVGPSVVPCKFKPALRAKVKEAVDRYVEVSGILYHRRGDEFPYQIDVEDLEIFPEETKLPSIFEIKGMVKGMQNKSSEEILEEGRNGNW